MGAAIAAAIEKSPTDKPAIYLFAFLSAIGAGAGGLLTVQFNTLRPFDPFGLPSIILVALGITGVIGGLAIAGLGMLASLRPEYRLGIGILIAVLGLFSFVTSWLGLFFIGPTMGLIAGALSIHYRPRPTAQEVPASSH
jgi:hypothetical protein